MFFFWFICTLHKALKVNYILYIIGVRELKWFGSQG